MKGCRDARKLNYPLPRHRHIPRHRHSQTQLTMRMPSSCSEVSPAAVVGAGADRRTPAMPCSRPTPACRVECRKRCRPWRRDSSLVWVSLSKAWLRSAALFSSADNRGSWLRQPPAVISSMGSVWQHSLRKFVRRLAISWQGAAHHTHTHTHHWLG